MAHWKMGACLKPGPKLELWSQSWFESWALVDRACDTWPLPKLGVSDEIKTAQFMAGSLASWP